MPLVTATVLAYAAGLLAGFGTSAPWAIGTAAAVVWLGARHPRDRVALSALAVAGIAIATAMSRAQSACATRLLGEASWRATLAAEASPGAFVRASHECGVALRLAVREGVAPAGSRVLVQGTPATMRGGILIGNARVRVERRPGILARWRSAVGRGIDASFGANGPLVRALLIADMNDLSPALRDRFSAAGLSHMLSVSGLHVGLIATAILMLGQIAGVGRGRADVLVVAITGLYVLAIGAPLPAVRSAVMLAVVSLSARVQRPTSPWAALSVGAAIPLLDPRAVIDVGFQLSIVGMVALVAAGALNKRWEWLAAGGWRGTLYRSLVTSTAATLLTAPLVAAVFGRLSFVAPLSNLAAVPVMAVLQPLLFLAALALPLPWLARFLADACHPLILAIESLASIAARLPGAAVGVVTDAVSLALACLMMAAFVIAAVSRFPGRALVVAAGALALIAWRPFIASAPGETELHVLDVGQGDAIALRTARGRWLLFDAGREWQGGDEGRRQIVPYVAARGGEVTAFVLSHPHADHVGGAASAIAALRPTWYYDPGYAGGSLSYRASLTAARDAHTSWRRVRPLDSLVVDEVTVTFLAPDSVWADSLSDPNDASTVARVRIGDVSMLLTGDAEAAEERWLVDNQRSLLAADILKVAHHGSNTSSTEEFLKAVRPTLAIVSVGAGNMYRHPSPVVMRSLAAHGALTLRTDVHGAVIIRTNGRRIEVEAAGERWTLRP